MRIVRYIDMYETESYGELENGKIRPIVGDIYGDFEFEEKVLDCSEVRIISPVKPGKLIAAALNYFEHVGELDFAANLPEEPVIFLVSNTAVIGSGEKITIPFPEHRVDHEGELAIIIGKTCCKVKEKEAKDYIFGYTCSNDVSDRDIQKKDGQWMRAKSFPTFKPIGPWIETDLNPENLNIQTLVNDKVRQSSNTKYMLFSAAKLVAFLSKFMTLFPGDVILSGTPEGVGPIKKGDVVEVKIEGIGSLKNIVI